MPNFSDISDYFKKPKLLSAFQLIDAPDRFFSIPALQRNFSWEIKDIRRLIDDIVKDMNRHMIFTENGDEPKFNKDAVSFIGTIVCREDTKHETIPEHVRDQAPDIIHIVIDGQQRLTVLMIISIILHNYIQTSIPDIDDSAWLKELCNHVSKRLALMFEKKRTVPGNNTRYPRMIREADDQWATNDQKQYNSPISRYIFDYGEHCHSPDNRRYDSLIDINQAITDETIHKVVESIYEKIEYLCNNSQKLPNIENILTGSPDAKIGILENLFEFNSTPPSNAIDPNNPKHTKTIRALLLSAYIMNKVCFASMVTTREDYAYDIFDSLNTTGELLTAYETFRPEIVRAERAKNFYKTASGIHEKAISQYLDSNQNKKQSKTFEMLISFALAENGHELPKELRDQRAYLRDRYQEITNIEDKRRFTKHLMHVSDVYHHFWYGTKTVAKVLDLESICEEKKVEEEILCARFCMDFLKTAKHSISLPLISRFYDMPKSLGNPTKKDALELCRIIKATAAFFALWRSCRGTDGIDNCYRDMFADSRESGRYFSRESNSVPSLVSVQEEFCSLLKENGGTSGTKFSSCEEWIQHARNYPIYTGGGGGGKTGGRAVAKFILLAASHNAKEEDNDPRYLMKVRHGAANSILDGKWNDKAYGSIEHIIPKSRSVGEKPDDSHRLGNLTLLPPIVNSILGTREWSGSKKELFRMIAADTPEEFNKIARELKTSISQKSIDDLWEADYLLMAKAISKWNEFDSIEHINERSENLMKMAWETLSKWLDF